MKRYKSQIYDGICYAEWCREDDGNTYCMVYWGDGDDWAPREPMEPGDASELECMALQELVQILREHNLPASARTLEDWLKMNAKKKKAAHGAPFEALFCSMVCAGMN